MKLKKSVRKKLIILLVIVVAILGVFFLKDVIFKKNTDVKEVKIVSKIEKYGYNLKENKPKAYKKMFEELEKILEAKEVKEEDYVKKIAEMFVFDFYSLDDKTAKTDVGGVEFVHKDALENFLDNAQDTYYKYVENNIYDNRKQTLPIVEKVTVNSVEKKAFAYGDKTDENAYEVKVSWDYTNSKYAKYQKTATLVFVHDDIKLSLVELQK